MNNTATNDLSYESKQVETSDDDSNKSKEPVAPPVETIAKKEAPKVIKKASLKKAIKSPKKKVSTKNYTRYVLHASSEKAKKFSDPKSQAMWSYVVKWKIHLEIDSQNKP